jgi:hypothetical protein
MMMSHPQFPSCAPRSTHDEWIEEPRGGRPRGVDQPPAPLPALAGLEE